MHVVEEISLLEFYHSYVERLRATDKKILILALVREADAPEFYADIHRYWDSLHNITGSSIVFAVAGTSSTKLISDHQYLPAKRVHSPLFASVGNVALDVLDPMQYEQMARARDEFRAQSELPRDMRPHELAQANTMQISELRDYLSLSERDLPCLHLTLLDREEAVGVLPLDSFRHFSIYAACREIVCALESPINECHRTKRDLENFERSALQNRVQVASAINELHKRVYALSPTLNESVENSLARLNGQLAGHRLETQLRSLLDRCTAGLADTAARDQAKSELAALVATGNMKRETTSAMRGLIDKVFNTGYAKPSQLILSEIHELEEKLRPLQDQLFDIDRSTADAISRFRKTVYEPKLDASKATLRGAFYDLVRSKVSTLPVQWDVFISYATPDRPLAERLFSQFDHSTKVFLDQYCLRPGERWRERIPEVQSQSRSTVPIVSQHSGAAHYQQSEIELAINLSRTTNHAVLPVRTPTADRMPFGLEQFQGLTIDAKNPKKTVVEIERILGVEIRSLAKEP